jgi:hypothetical protein
MGWLETAFGLDGEAGPVAARAAVGPQVPEMEIKSIFVTTRQPTTSNRDFGDNLTIMSLIPCIGSTTRTRATHLDDVVWERVSPFGGCCKRPS